MGKRILILSASAGSGHIRAAQAIEEAAKKDPRVSEVLHIDSLEYTNKAFQRMYSQGYLDIVTKVPEICGFWYDATDKPWQTSWTLSLMHKANTQPLVKKLLDFQPDLCICTHGMPADIVVNLLHQDKLRTNLGIVVTDYHVHAFWLFDTFTRYFVPREECKRYISILGIPSDRVVVSGIPVSEAFSSGEGRRELRAKHGFRAELPLVLLSAGAFGLMSAGDIMKILERIETPCQIVVVCGKNEELKAALAGFIESRGKEMRNEYRIVGYTDIMHEYMRMADLFIGKPGGLATSECLVCGLPMIVWDPIPGQEIYNTYHVLGSGAGVMPDSSLTIGFKVDEILSNPETQRAMSAAARSIAFPHAAQTVLDAMLENPDEVPVRIDTPEL